MNESPYSHLISQKETCNQSAWLWLIQLSKELVIGLSRRQDIQPSKVIRHIPTLTVNSKDAELAELYRLEGNIFFEKKEYMMAHKRYTQSIAHAPAGSEILGAAYTCRGKTLFHNNYQSDCLIDFQQAEKNGLPDYCKTELYYWKAFATRELKMDKKFIKNSIYQARKWLSSVSAESLREFYAEKIELFNLCTIVKPKCYSLDFQDASLPTIKKINKMVPGLSNSVKVKYSEKYGRHVVATQDIRAGETIGMDKPYTSVAMTDLRYNVCWHCKKQSWSSIPCDTCSQVVFCSTTCKKQALIEYHDIECFVMGHLMAFSMHNQMFVTIRVVIMAIKEANNSLDQLQKTVSEIDNSTDPLTKGFINGKLDSTKFQSVYGLCDPSPADLQGPVLAWAIVISYFISKKMNLFQEECPGYLTPLINDQKFLDFVMIVKKFINIVAHNLYDYSVLSNAKSVTISALLVPSLNFFNHSCSPNAIRFYRNGNLVVATISPIKKGEQVFHSYGQYWYMNSKDIRQNALYYHFRFICNCQACTEMWPEPAEDLYGQEILANRSFTYKGPHMNKKLLSIIEKYVKATETAADVVQTSNKSYPINKIVAEFAQFVNDNHLCYYNWSYEMFKIGRFIEDLYWISQRFFFNLPGENLESVNRLIYQAFD